MLHSKHRLYHVLGPHLDGDGFSLIKMSRLLHGETVLSKSYDSSFFQKSILIHYCTYHSDGWSYGNEDLTIHNKNDFSIIRCLDANNPHAFPGYCGALHLQGPFNIVSQLTGFKLSTPLWRALICQP